MSINQRPPSVIFSLGRFGHSVDSRFYGDHTLGYRKNIDQFARAVLDPDGGKVLLTGFSGVGKTYLIEQFASNVGHYISKTPYNDLVVVSVTSSDAYAIKKMNGGVHLYLNACMDTFKVPFEELCFVTEDVELAAMITSFNPRAKVVLELNVQTLVKIAQMEENGASKIWSSWDVIDVNDVLLSLSDLMTTLKDIVGKKVGGYNMPLPEGSIESLVELFLEKIPEAISDYEEGETPDSAIVLIPVGLWAMAVRRLSTAIAFDVDSDSVELREPTADSVQRCVDAVFDESADVFIEFIQDMQDSDIQGSQIFVDGDGPIIQILQNALSEPFPSGSRGKQRREDTDTKPIKFNDLKAVQKSLKGALFGQDEAVESVCRSLSVPMAGIHDTAKPMRSVLFLGPTGVGKTQLALSLAEGLLEDPMNVIRLDMSEYAQSHEASKLFGAPSGYVGHEDGGVLTNAVLDNPRSLILLDEVEKAHPKIWDSFLQVLDSGRMTDNHGEVVDFSETIIIMTSNLGAQESKVGLNLGFSNSSDEKARKDKIITSEVEKFFKPEFINRIDDMIYFNSLTESDARKIVRREVSIIAKRVKSKGYKLAEVDENIVDKVLELSNFSKYGARDIQRTVFRGISEPLAIRMLSKRHSKKNIALKLNKNDIEVQ